MNMTEYLQFLKNKKSPFYGQDINDQSIDGDFDIPTYNKERWSTYTDEHWINIISKKK